MERGTLASSYYAQGFSRRHLKLGRATHSNQKKKGSKTVLIGPERGEDIRDRKVDRRRRLVSTLAA
jgi:hypothetical protein